MKPPSPEALGASGAAALSEANQPMDVLFVVVSVSRGLRLEGRKAAKFLASIQFQHSSTIIIIVVVVRAFSLQ
jgi:hypothetical protein